MKMCFIIKYLTDYIRIHNLATEQDYPFITVYKILDYKKVYSLTFALRTTPKISVASMALKTKKKKF